MTCAPLAYLPAAAAGRGWTLNDVDELEASDPTDDSCEMREERALPMALALPPMEDSCETREEPPLPLAPLPPA